MEPKANVLNYIGLARSADRDNDATDEVGI